MGIQDINKIIDEIPNVARPVNLLTASIFHLSCSSLLMVLYPASKKLTFPVCIINPSTRSISPQNKFIYSGIDVSTLNLRVVLMFPCFHSKTTPIYSQDVPYYFTGGKQVSYLWYSPNLCFSQSKTIKSHTVRTK